MDTQKAELIKVLVESKGIVTTACEKFDIPRSTYYLWYNSDQEFKEAVDDIHNVVLDFAEGRLYDLVQKGDVTATIFLLKTRGKKRGYVEKSPDEEQPPVIISVNVDKAETVAIGKDLMEEVFGKSA